jgi:SAM-dependent methyltransferase
MARILAPKLPKATKLDHSNLIRRRRTRFGHFEPRAGAEMRQSGSAAPNQVAASFRDHFLLVRGYREPSRSATASMTDRWTGLKPGERPYRDAAWFYAEYRYLPSEEFVRLLAVHLGWSRSDRVLDLGAGPAHLSLRLAPFAGEVVVMDPEEAMLEEGRRRATAAGVGNLSFVAGGSDDLARLSPELGRFATVTISQAFHWMADQDAVLRTLDGLLEPERGAVAIVGYVKEPDYNLIWLEREPWNAAGAILRQHLAGVPEGPNPAGRHDPFPDLLARSAFPRVELLTYEHEAVVQPSIAAAIGFQYSLGNVLARLGERRAAFEADVRAELAGADTAPLTVRRVDSALIGNRPVRP